MRIVFLGASHGVPEANRRCSCIMVETHQNRYFIDMGTAAIEQLRTRSIPIESVKAIFVTHMHGDHTDGIISFVDLCNWYFKKASPVFVMPEPVLQTKSAISAWLKCNGQTMRDFDFRPVSEGLCYQDDLVKITAFKTQHTDMSFAFLLEAENKRVLFSGDLSMRGPAADFPVSVFKQPVDLAICECAHFSAKAYLPIFENQKNLKSLCFNHYGDCFMGSIFEVRKALESADIPVYIAEDGTEFNL